MSPTARTLALLRERGYIAQVVERWIPQANIRVDLFGFIDIVALGKGRTLAIQACIGDDITKREDKIKRAPTLPSVLASGWVVLVVGWRKSARTKRWYFRIVRVRETYRSEDTDAALPSSSEDEGEQGSCRPLVD